jgi:hypothetical protein
LGWSNSATHAALFRTKRRDIGNFIGRRRAFRLTEPHDNATHRVLLPKVNMALRHRAFQVLVTQLVGDEVIVFVDLGRELIFKGYER